MVSVSDHTCKLRLLESKKPELAGKDYRRSYAARDESSGQILAQCDVYRNSVFSGLRITDQQGQLWEMRPNRKIIPTRWYFEAPGGNRVFEIRLPNILCMLNPLARTFLHLKDMPAQRSYKFIDLEGGIVD